MKPRRSQALLSAAVWIAAALWVVAAARHGYHVADPRLMLLSTAVVCLGELLEVDLRGGRSTPVSAAVVFALFVVLESPVSVVLIAGSAYLIGLFVKSGEFGWGPRFRSTTRRFAATAAALAFYVFITKAGAGLVASSGYKGVILFKAAAMVAAAMLQLLFDTGASALFISRVQFIPALPVWKGQVYNRFALHGAFVSVAALMALAYAVLSEAALVLFLLPLLAARYSFRRYASIHKTYVQTIRALSKVPELAGYSPTGHSAAVAVLATAIARQRGLSDNEVQDLEFAALLHDIGRISFDEPDEIQASGNAPLNRQAVADVSATVVAKTPYLEKVARIVREHEQIDGERLLLESKILRLANEFVEQIELGGADLSPYDVLARMDRDSSRSHEHDLVNTLGRLVATDAIGAHRT